MLGKASLRQGKLSKEVQFGVLEMGGRFVFVVISGCLTSFQAECYLHRKICLTMLGFVQSLMKMVIAGMKNVCLPNSLPMKLKPFWGFPSVYTKSLTHLFRQVLNPGSIRQRVHINCSLELRLLDHQTFQFTVVPGIKFGNWKF